MRGYQHLEVSPRTTPPMSLRFFDRNDAAELLRHKPLDEIPVSAAMQVRALTTFDAHSVRSGEAECYHRLET